MKGKGNFSVILRVLSQIICVIDLCLSELFHGLNKQSLFLPLKYLLRSNLFVLFICSAVLFVYLCYIQMVVGTLWCLFYLCCYHIQIVYSRDAMPFILVMIPYIGSFSCVFTIFSQLQTRSVYYASQLPNSLPCPSVWPSRYFVRTISQELKFIEISQ